MSKSSIKKNGIVHSFNVSPKGQYEGLLLETGKEIIQVNFSPEWSVNIAALAPPKTQINVEISPRESHGHPAHAVYDLVSLDGNKNPTPPNHSNGSRPGHFSGTVASLNYALHGEVNGAILDSGDFLHLKPHGAAAVELSVGMQVEGTGPTKPMVGGYYVIEADEVNGVVLEKKPKPKKKPHH